MATYNAASLSTTDVQAAIDQATSPGDIVQLPSGTVNWTSGVTWNVPVGGQLIGAGTSAVGGGDQTVIQDNIAGNLAVIQLNIPTTGLVRMSGITVKSGTGTTKDNGTVVISGAGNVRIDHCRFNMSSTANYKVVLLGSGVRGVMDSCILDLAATNAIYPYNGRFHPSNGEQVGDYEWTQPTGFGTSDFFFVEDCVITGTTTNETRVWDGFTGAKMVVRFNTLVNSCINETHDTGHSFDDRGTRASEAYGNLVTKVGENEPNRLAVMVGNGTNLAWGNSWDQVYKSIYFLKINRKNVSNNNNVQTPTPDGWGHTGSPVATGTVNVSGTAVTHVSGNTFSTSWPAGTVIYIEGMTAVGWPGGSERENGAIASVASTTSLTLDHGGHTGPNLTGARYWVGSNWDGNTNAYGYPAIDQPGRGAGDLLTGVFPSKVNSTTGTIAWPNQTLEPIYWWNNTGTFVAGWSGATVNNEAGENLIQSDRDYYLPASGIQTNATTPFNGTTGVGWGTLANRPTTCTPGVAYFAIDQGDWNQSASNPYGVNMAGLSGVLYKCTSTDTWTEYYEPYTYPHPLRGEDLGDQYAETPEFSPVEGEYEGNQVVTITTGTSGATIRYTLDGSTPTSSNGTIYSSPIGVATDTTIKAVAYKSGFLDSLVATADYVINPSEPGPGISASGLNANRVIIG